MTTENVNQQDTGLGRIIRGLTWIGTIFLVLTAVAVVWAVFRTHGIEDFITALTVTGLGFGLPAVVAFVVAWLLGTFDSGEEAGERTAQAAGPDGSAIPERAPFPLVGYVIAVISVGVAWAMRAWLDPILGREVPYITFFLAVAMAAWASGMWPAMLATLLSLLIAWYFYVGGPGFEIGNLRETVGLGLFVAVSLCIGGITSALRAAREQAQRLVGAAVGREKAVEEARGELARERDRFAVTLASIGDGVIATDALGNVTFINATAERLTGWPSAEALNRPINKVFRVIDEESRQTIKGPVEHVITSRAAVEASDNTVLINRRGAEYAIDDSAAPILDAAGALLGSVLVFRDITDQRRAHATLEESELRFRHMADQTPAMIWMADDSRALTYFNRTWLGFTGRTLEQEQGDGWTAGVHPEDFAHTMSVYATSFEARVPFEAEFRLKRNDGEYRWVFNRGTPRFDEDERFEGYIGAALDVTDRKAAEEALGHADRRQNEFLAMLAHELRNPLAPIRNAIQIMERINSGQDRRIDHAREVIDRQSAHLTRLIDDLLEVSRIDSGKVTLRREKVAVQEIVRRAADAQMAMVAERRQTLDVRLPDARVFVSGDAARLGQAFGNVLNNAVKFTRDDGKGRIEVTMAVTDDEVEVAIQDNGEGIDASLLPHLFELYRQGADVERHGNAGLGLGLTIVQRLVELHGGRVTANSAGRGQGSRFTITLPLAEPAARAAHAGQEARPAERQPARVLVVDDNVDAAEAIATLLQFSGYEIEVAHDPHQALETAARTLPDLVLLDIGLPGMTGYEVAHRLREGNGRRAKIVALTGYGQEQDNEQAKAAGFAAYLVKPVDADELTALVNELTDGR